MIVTFGFAASVSVKTFLFRAFFPSLWELSEWRKCILYSDNWLAPRSGSIFSICVVA